MEKIGGFIGENIVTIAVIGIVGCFILYQFSIRKHRQAEMRDAMFDEVNSKSYDEDVIQ